MATIVYHRGAIRMLYRECVSCAQLLLSGAFLLLASFCAHASDTVEEMHRYREVTGDLTKEITWHLHRGDALVLTYTSPTERHVTTTGHAYETIRWKVADYASNTDLVATRIDNAIKVKGRFKNITVEKNLVIDACPWYQATSLSLRDLIASSHSETIFWTIRLDTLSVHKLRAVKMEVEQVEASGVFKRIQRVRLRAAGFLAPFWKSDYWFTLPDCVFYRFEGPSGPPGSPKTVVILKGS